MLAEQFVKTSSNRHCPEFFRRKKKPDEKNCVTFTDNQEEYNSLPTEKELNSASLVRLPDLLKYIMISWNKWEDRERWNSQDNLTAYGILENF
jgi:hypothetical protein